jgi:hypothetical protein
MISFVSSLDCKFGQESRFDHGGTSYFVLFSAPVVHGAVQLIYLVIQVLFNGEAITVGEVQ